MRVTPRKVYRDKQSRKYLDQRERDALPADSRNELEEKPLTEHDYYYTKYGTPLAYVRPLELLARSGFKTAADRRILDYGYGGIGHLRLLASRGAETVGVDVDSYLRALYNDPADQGPVHSNGRRGSIKLVDGSFPGHADTRRAVGDGFDLILSKNTLKNGYIHPAEPVDPRKLVQLGVADDDFVRVLFEILKPGGLVMIYNICPAPAKPGQPYIPWADGRSPFSRAQWESAGFRVLALDQDDTPDVRTMARALGWHEGEGGIDVENNLFGLYTLVEKPAVAPNPVP
jgi:hypothetical protein